MYLRTEKEILILQNFIFLDKRPIFFGNGGYLCSMYHPKLLWIIFAIELLNLKARSNFYYEMIQSYRNFWQGQQQSNVSWEKKVQCASLF